MEEKQVNEQVETVDATSEEILENVADEVEIIDGNEEKGSNETNHEGLTQLEEEKAALEERILRLQAEYENFKRRTNKERIAERQYKSQDLASELLPVLDNFERALQTEVTAENQSFKDGVQMVYDQLTNALTSQGVEAIQALNESFDPNLHHAVMQTSEPDVAANTIVEELQKGYMLKDKVLRPTMVKVNQ